MGFRSIKKSREKDVYLLQVPKIQTPPDPHPPVF
jgi:hypothetical protein